MATAMQMRRCDLECLNHRRSDDRLDRLGQQKRVASGCRHKLGIPDDLPEMPIGILEIAGIAAIEGLLGGLDDLCSGGTGLRHHDVDLGFFGDVVADGEGGGARSRARQPRVVGNIGARP